MAILTQHTVSTPYMVGPVHFYSGEINGELALFDTGPPIDGARQYLQQNIELNRLKHVFITHCHIDHWGQAAWLEENFGAIVYLPYRDSLKIAGLEARAEAIYEMLFELGFDDSILSELQTVFRSGVLFPPFPRNYLIAEDHVQPEAGMRILNCPGHSQADIVYVGDAWAVTGDTLLKGVFQSPLLDVDLVTGGRFKNYESYCESIVKLATLRDKIILPGHRKNINSVDETLLFYITKLLARVQQMQPYRDEDNLLRLIRLLVGERMQEVFHLFLKASEIVFMKDLLAQPELLRRSLETIGLFDEVAELYGSAVNI